MKCNNFPLKLMLILKEISNNVLGLFRVLCIFIREERGTTVSSATETAGARCGSQTSVNLSLNRSIKAIT